MNSEPCGKTSNVKILWFSKQLKKYRQIKLIQLLLIDRTLFVDCLVVAGHNPAIMLIKELIESKQLTGQAANFALSSLGFYAKTPTRELLHELLVRYIW